MSDRDAIVIGAGPNGLTTAALLARAGRNVVVVERRPVTGGLAASEEFHPGYRSAGLLYDTTGLRRRVVDSLELTRQGLTLRDARPDVLALGNAGDGLLLSGRTETAIREIGAHSSRDAGRYAEYRRVLDGLRGVLGRFFDESPLDVVRPESMGLRNLARRALRLRRLGRREMMELLRIVPMSVADWLDEWFENDLLKSALALPAVAGTFAGPRSPGSNANLLLWDSSAGTGVAGGAPNLVAALERAAVSHGVQLRTHAAVARILTGSDGVRGVRLEDGEELAAPVVAASCDPRQTLLRLLAPGVIPLGLRRRMEAFRARGTTAQVLLALSSIPTYACRPGEAVELARTGGNLDDIERAFDAMKYRGLPRLPVLEIHQPTIALPELAPRGHAVLSILVHFVPRDLRPEWDAEGRERVGARVVEILERVSPGSAAAIVARDVRSPLDLERRYGISGGHPHHGEHALDQILVRPAPECSSYATPVPGLFLCGSGSHPGGGLTCAPGALAASRILGTR